MKILAIIQARASSSRLPGKVLKTILGKTLLELQIERVLRSKYIDKLIVATSTWNEDDPIEEICKKVGIDCFRGNLNNVLDRFYKAACGFKPQHVVRLTGDCPLSDSKVIDDVIELYFDGEYDYATNAVKPTFPDGLDIEIFSFAALKDAYENAELPSHLEHVTPYIRECGNNYIGHYETDFDYSYLRWTVDEPEDFVLVKHVFEKLYPFDPFFSWKRVLIFLKDNSELIEINRKFLRNEGMQKSQKKDSEYLESVRRNMNK